MLAKSRENISALNNIPGDNPTTEYPFTIAKIPES